MKIVTKKKYDQHAYLPFAAPWFGTEEREELLATLESDWITTGPRTEKFEKAFAAYVGTAEAVAVNSCTAALHLGLTALDVGVRDAVITTPFTFAATANVIVHRGAFPAFVDIDPDTYINFITHLNSGQTLINFGKVKNDFAAELNSYQVLIYNMKRVGIQWLKKIKRGF